MLEVIYYSLASLHSILAVTTSLQTFFHAVTTFFTNTHAGAPWEYNPLDNLPNKPVVLYFSEYDSQQRYFNISGTHNIRTSTSFLGDGLYGCTMELARLNLDRSTVDHT